jgi:phosphoesterase RecJ-like protein
MFKQINERKNNTLREIWRALRKSKRILMTLHPSPDGDALGSCAAMKYVLEKKGIEVKLVSNDRINKSLEIFDFNKEVEYETDIEKLDLNEFDYIVFLDHGGLYGHSEEFKEGLKNARVINIDHHETNSYYGNLNYVHPEKPSCCSILYEFFEKIRFRFDRELSLRLLLGICTDTNFFSLGNSLDNLRTALTLLERGKLNYKKDLYDPLKADHWELKKYQGLLLMNMKKTEINGRLVAYSWATKKEFEKLNLMDSDARFGISCMQNIKDLNLIFTLTELDGKIKGSFRSKGIDTTIYSSEFNGGGHKEASGFEIRTKDMKKAIEQVLKVIKEKGFVEIGNKNL